MEKHLLMLRGMLSEDWVCTFAPFFIHIFPEVVEHSCALASHMMGETVENVSRNIDTYSFRQPLGVTAGICPFNFPAMIPLWVIEFKL